MARESQTSRVRTFRQRLPKASEALAHELLNDIVSKGLGPGDRLPMESDMVGQYGVARSTVREALRILEINGLVAIRSGPNGGPVVGRVGASDFGRMVSLFMHAERMTLQEILEARRLLEPVFMKEATQRQEPAFLAQVADLRKRGQEIDVNSTDEYVPLAREFHELIVSASANRPLALFAMALMYLTKLDHGVYSIDRRRVIMKQHDQILAAILERDEARVEKLMAQHMDDFCSTASARQPETWTKIVSWG